MTTIDFQNERVVAEEDLGLTLLEIAGKHNIPHIHACGGNARCSTCRVLIVEHLENVLPRNAAEARLAARKGLEDNIRLACQTRIRGPVALRRLVLDDNDVDLVLAQSATSGREGKLAILFSDIRNFTGFAEQNLPYDVIHMLNRYFQQMGDAVLQNQGYIDKYIGDGLMALFGLVEGEPETICLNAVTAGLQMVDGMEALNRDYLFKHFGIRYRIGVGIHFGEVLIGELGHPRKMQFTAIGDAVNTASRIESSTKEAGVQLLISSAVHAHVAGKVCTGKIIDVPLKGKSGEHRLLEITSLKDQALEAFSLRARLEKELHPIVTTQNAPAFLRLVFHDAGTYDAASGTGGANGSIRLPEELKRVENLGISGSIRTIGRVKAILPEVSWADLIAFAGAAAVARCGGPHILLPLGRPDTDVPDPEGRLLPLEELHARELKENFAKMGLTVQEMVALSGAHTIGKAHGMPFTEDLFTFNNSYFKLILDSAGESTEHLLNSDRTLVEDPECRAYVEKYARSQDAFFKDFASAFAKLTLLGTDISA